MTATTFDPATVSARVQALQAAGKRSELILADLKRQYDMDEAQAQEFVASPAAQTLKFDGRRASGIRPRRVRWLWKPWVPLGAMSLLYGEEGLGKGATAADIAARASLGSLDGDLEGQPGNVEWVTFEDDPEAVLVPRLLAAGADLDRITFHDESDNYDSPLVLPDDVAALSEAMAERESRLLVIDPLPDALREGLKDNNNGDVRTGIRPLQQMAKQLGVAVLGVAHPNKGAKTAADKVMGSKAWRSVPRSVLMLARDPDNPDGDTRVLCVTKRNSAAEKPSVLLKIESVDIDALDEDGDPIGSQPRVVIVGDSSYTDADLITFQVAGKVAGKSTPQSQEARAEDVLMRLLEASGGEVAASQAYATGEAVGVSEATMRRARQKLGVLSEGRQWVAPEDWNPPLLP